MCRGWGSMMGLVVALTLVAACASDGPADAPNEATGSAPERAIPLQPLDGIEVSDLLTGNTVVGEWFGTPYRQFFDADGTTLYQEQGDRPSSGKWRVNPDTGTYESTWSDLGRWEAYPILREGDTLYWQDFDGELLGFRVVEGDQVPRP